MDMTDRQPGVYLLAQTEWSGHRGVFHGTLADRSPICGVKFRARPLLTRDMGRMLNRQPCSRCYGKDVKAITILREDKAALS